MPLFVIERKLPGASRDDVDAAGYRASACAFNYPGLKWVSSYWSEAAERILCLYEAENMEQIEHHSERARIPCDLILPVEHIDPALFADSLPSSTAG